MSKERVVFDALDSESLAQVERTVLLVHSVMVANGFIPEGITSVSTSDGGKAINLWPVGRGTEGVYPLKYIGGTEVKCIHVTPSRVMVHSSLGSELLTCEINLGADADTTIASIKNHIVHPILSKQYTTYSQQQQEQNQREGRPRVFVVPEPSPAGPFLPPRAPAFGTPIGPGELVGPNHPIFTGEPEGGRQRPGGLLDPRFDPIGPGHIGEPNADHFPPPPFGEPPGGRRPPGRAPLRGPGANLGPGDMFM